MISLFRATAGCSSVSGVGQASKESGLAHHQRTQEKDRAFLWNLNFPVIMRSLWPKDKNNNLLLFL